MLDLLRLLFDTGLFILIWLVQLVVYPSFQYYAEKDLSLWHQKYTGRIVVIVLPLMLGELIITGLQILHEPSFYSLSSGILIGYIWFNTFFQAIPLHLKIDQKEEMAISIKKLIRVNAVRTILWTLLFLMTCVVYFQQL